MQKAWWTIKHKASTGFTIAEILVSVAVFGLVVASVSAALVTLARHQKGAGQKEQAVFLAEEGLEAVRNIRDAAFSNLSDGTYGLAQTGGQWVLSGSQDVTGLFTRQIVISTVAANQKQVTVKVNWPQGTLARSVSVSGYLTNWQLATAAAKKGMLVYGNGSTTSDSVLYELFNSDGTWSAPVATADVDVATSNRALRYAKLYASPTRDEYALVSRHYNGTTQYVYAQVYDGSSATWGNVQLLASWNASTLMNVRNFSGTYLNNGDFMVVYSDNTTTPKFRVWNGAAWGGQVAMKVLTGTPIFIRAAARPGSDEVMAVFFNTAQDAQSEYYSGAGYTTANWTSATTHATNAAANNRETIDFEWSPNNSLVGMMVMSATNNNRKITTRVATADGAGGVNWGNTTNNGANQPNGHGVGSYAISARAGSNEYIVCDKDVNATPNIYCYNSNYTPSITSPSNKTIASPTQNGIQRSFDAVYEKASGVKALIVYSDNTSTPKYKLYDPASTIWDAAPTSIGVLNGVTDTVRVLADPGSDDIMVVMADNALDVYTVLWDAANSAMYTSPAGKNLLLHGTSGSAYTDYWYDFAWGLH